MRADEHLSKLDEVAVLLVVHFNDTPWVATALEPCDPQGLVTSVVGTDDSERHLRHDLLVLRDGLLVIELVPRTFEDLNRVVWMSASI